MLGELHKQGWNPKRTIIYCAWDGEEPGLLGSTEWVETHGDELQKHAVAYINSDSNGRGFFHAAGSHDLEKLINDVIREIKDPEKDISVWQRARLPRIANAKNPEERGEIRKRAELAIGALGDGSDYASFLDHAGISALNIGYGGENDADAYHSIYDDFYWYTKFVDTDFSYGRALAQTGGTAVLRLADAELIPYEYVANGRHYRQIRVRTGETAQRQAGRDQGAQPGIERRSFHGRRRSAQDFCASTTRSRASVHEFRAAEEWRGCHQESADRYQAAAAKAQTEGATPLSARALDSLNTDLLLIQRTFLTERGLPERPWFKHQVYAPGAYTGYGAKPLAAVREYMDEKKWAEADAQVPGVAKVLEDVAAAIGKAADELESAESGR